MLIVQSSLREKIPTVAEATLRFGLTADVMRPIVELVIASHCRHAQRGSSSWRARRKVFGRWQPFRTIEITLNGAADGTSTIILRVYPRSELKDVLATIIPLWLPFFVLGLIAPFLSAHGKLGIAVVIGSVLILAPGVIVAMWFRGFVDKWLEEFAWWQKRLSAEAGDAVAGLTSMPPLDTDGKHRS